MALHPNARPALVGSTMVLPLFLGQDSANVPHKNGLGIDHFYVGEAVSVVRVNDRRTIGKVTAIDSREIAVSLWVGLVTHVPKDSVAQVIGKLLGNYYLADDIGDLRQYFGDVKQTLKIGQTTLQPILLGSDCSGMDHRMSLTADHFYVGEAVAVLRSDNAITVGKVNVASSERIVLDLGGDHEKTIVAIDVPTYVGKLIGCYYLKASEHINQSTLPVTITKVPRAQVEEVFNLPKIRAQIKAGIYRRTLDLEKEICKVFEMHATPNDTVPDLKFLPADQLRAALQPFDRVMNAGLRKATDGSMLDRNEFRKLALLPSPLEAWSRSLPLADLLADCLPRSSLTHDDPLRRVSMMTSAEIECVIQGFAEGLNTVLSEHLERLKKAYAAMDKQQQRLSKNKFEVVDMNSGSIEDFHSGLQGRIGSCHLDFEKAIELEHCVRSGCDTSFVTPNFGIKTSPKREWKIVVEGEPIADYEKCHNREIPNIEQLHRKDTAMRSGLIKAEVIALVLYTGPLYHLYNTILRRHPAELFEQFKSGNNLFPTTIFVLVSAVQKISRVMSMRDGLRLYRGLGGNVALPDSFFKSDTNGCKGFLDWGFMSTSLLKAVAIKYSGIEESNTTPVVLSIRVGAVDRGACIKEFSQYSDEEEFLFGPCSFLEQDGPLEMEVTDFGVVKVFPVKVNSNLKTLTVDEMLGQKKKMHISAFTYLIDEIDRKLHEMADEGTMTTRLIKDPTNNPHKYSGSGFLTQIVQQCKDVLSVHQSVNDVEYSEERKFYSLVVEMVDVKVMALSKLEEWLVNESTSFICYRWNSPLRTVHRRWISWLERAYLDCEPEQKSAAALRLCQAKKYIVNTPHELNELKEARLLAAAAEGCSVEQLRLLVEAGADLHSARPDGVTAIWLAAQFGHSHCIAVLADLKASVHQCANDGATPVYIAAQSGNFECIEVLYGLGADMNKADSKGMTPVHQAALNGRTATIRTLHYLGASVDKPNYIGITPLQLATTSKQLKCIKLLGELLTSNDYCAPPAIKLPEEHQRILIISSGDICDVDGFLALAEYAKTGADVLFIMNYPAYIAVREESETYADNNPGLGFKYSAQKVFDRDAGKHKEYEAFLQCYKEIQTPNERTKSALTDMAYHLVHKVWHEAKAVSGGSGELLFCIGGINAVNPFSDQAIKNEILIYSALIPGTVKRLPSTREGEVYNAKRGLDPVQWSKYSRIYMDFNGPMSFWNESWANKLSEPEVVRRIYGVFIMGGIYADITPLTSPSIPKVLNRFSCATMNQLYHPQNAADFFAFLHQNKVPAFTVTNNVIADLKTDEGVTRFLLANGIGRPFLKELAIMHYQRSFRPVRKAFDYYTALALTKFLLNPAGNRLITFKKTLMYSNVYGITFVSNTNTWEETLSTYCRTLDLSEAEGDSQDLKTRKDCFRKEISIIKAIKYMASLPVNDLQFELNELTMALKISEYPQTVLKAQASRRNERAYC